MDETFDRPLQQSFRSDPSHDEPLAIRQSVATWSELIGLLWATAWLHPDQREAAADLAGQLYVAYCRSLGVDPRSCMDLLDLPPWLLQSVTDHA